MLLFSTKNKFYGIKQINAKSNKIFNINNIFIKLSKKNLYYDIGKINTSNKNTNFSKGNSHTRNLDFVFNLGYNNLSDLIETNIPLTKMFWFLRNKKLINKIKTNYFDLIEAIEFGDIEALDEILEQNIKYCLYNDLTKYNKNKYTFKILNKSSPLDIKFLAFNELFNIEIDREKNYITKDYVMAPFKKNKYILANEKTYKIKENKSYQEIELEKKTFEESDFKAIAYTHFCGGLNDLFKIEYCKLKLKPNSSDEEIDYFVKIINRVENTEHSNDQYSMHLKKEFSDYFELREKFIKEKKEKVELYEYFKENLTNLYKQFFEKNSNKSFIRNMIVLMKRIWFNKINSPKKNVFGKKSIQVLDIEISSKMRIEIYDENNNNILDSKFGYSNIFKNYNQEKENLNDYHEYDINYNFDIPKWEWDLNNLNYNQKHVIRIEYEKLNKRLFTSRNMYNTMKITDIDLALNGNRHFKIIKDKL